MNRSYYNNSIQNFFKDDTFFILGELTIKHNHALEDLQRNAWVKQIEILKEVLPSDTDGHIFFEFAIPRMGKRVDNIIIIDDLIFVLEFKVGDKKHEKHTVDQVIDYCLDLKNFHEGSHHEKIFPVVVSTEAESKENVIEKQQDLLYSPLFANRRDLFEVLQSCFSEKENAPIVPLDWESSIYKPTPTIVEAAQALYKGHDVKEISRSDGGAINLSLTSNCIDEVIDHSKMNNKKSICFVTGVPGAGKTLAGLNIANQRMNIDENEHAVFLSGNGPLVDVLREALTRDEVQNVKNNGGSITKKEAAIKANAFIQNIHHFRDDSLTTNEAPTEKVVVFDEAQRAWTHKQASSFMKRKKGVDNFDMSEPEFLIGVMDRHDDWCTIICLIGGGQEINVGEAGLEEWINSLKSKFTDWDIYYSDLIVEDENYLKDKSLQIWLQENAIQKTDLHLAVSVRSFRSERLSDFVHAILENKPALANDIYLNDLSGKYPVVITRYIEKAKEWLKDNARGNERIGITASSGANRLRPLGVNIKSKIDPPIWFLNKKDDVRSSFFLEETATEFDIQGLELDWTCVCWDANLYIEDNVWKFRKFKGTKWQNINQDIQKSYLLNAYRVLLTRARQGMVIFVPEGDKNDKTRDPKIYNDIFEYLESVGIEEI